MTFLTNENIHLRGPVRHTLAATFSIVRIEHDLMQRRRPQEGQSWVSTRRVVDLTEHWAKHLVELMGVLMRPVGSVE
jgi:hypothetical protein